MSEHPRLLRRRTGIPGLVAALLLTSIALPTAATRLTVEPEYPLQGSEAVLELRADATPVVGATVEALYRPASEASFTRSLGTTDERGRLTWTPEATGLVVLTAGEGDDAAELRVAVRAGRLPPSGVVIFVVAVVLLFGGAGLALLALLRSGAEPG